jgi:hypothetical protein
VSHEQLETSAADGGGHSGGEIGSTGTGDNEDDQDCRGKAIVTTSGDEADDIDAAQLCKKEAGEAYSTTKRNHFPGRLMELLESDEAKCAIWWLPAGESFAIQPKEFSKTILTKYFRGTKFESFIRKLNRW